VLSFDSEKDNSKQAGVKSKVHIALPHAEEGPVPVANLVALIEM
jgi:hypothetical protein